MRIELPNGGDGGVGQAGDHIEPGHVGNHDRVVCRRFCRRNLKAVALGLLGDESGGNQLGDVVLGLPAEELGVVEPEEGRIGVHRVALFIGQPNDSARHLAGAGVVGGGSEVQRPEAPVQIGQVPNRRVGGLVRIPPLIHPGIHSQAVALPVRFMNCHMPTALARLVAVLEKPLSISAR